MDLFDQEPYPNLLPHNGTVKYFGRILNYQKSHFYFNELLNNILWKQDKVIIRNQEIRTKRKVALYGDKQYHYTYSNTRKQALLWTKELIQLKEIIEKVTRTTFNSCLLNLYHDGNEGMSWHSDDEAVLGKNTTIASLSLGAERSFSFKHKKTKETRSLFLETGSLLLMTGTTQHHWWHCLPKTAKIIEPRVNLTFRTIVEV